MIGVIYRQILKEIRGTLPKGSNTCHNYCLIRHFRLIKAVGDTNQFLIRKAKFCLCCIF